LVDAANEAGGEDNITVLIVDVLEAPPPAAPDPDALTTAVQPSTPIPTSAPDVLMPEPKPRRRRLRSVGAVILFLLPVLAIIGAAIGAIAWYAHHTYFVGYQSDNVVVYRGIPGGILGWNPTVERDTGINKSSLTKDAVDLIQRSGKGSLSRTNQIVANLQRAVATTTTTTSTTTTTRPTSTTHPKATTTTVRGP
jgi:protein phosphatase